MSTAACERRKYPRYDTTPSLFLHPLMASHRTFPCKARDISPRGLQVLISEPLADGVRVELWIKLDDQPGTFLLRGNVRWSRRLDGEYVLGIALDEDQHDLDMETWTALLMPMPDRAAG
ncbi:MAG: PilZ domain-containing protein [Pseudomonadota bacterium]